MSEHDAAQLQAQVDSAMAIAAGAGLTIHRIQLDHGSDVTDLKQNVDVRVFANEGCGYRLFTIVTAELMARLLNRESPRDNAFTTGGPLIVVSHIDGEIVVKSVARYLELEGRLPAC